MPPIFAKKLARLLTASALVMVTAACASRPTNTHAGASPDVPNSYVESALVDQGDLSTFYQALLTTGVMRELNGNTDYSIFAPTNAAFAEIRPRIYPCFYAVQCRPQVAALMRNHIVARNESINRFSKWGGDIPTLGNSRIDVEEPYQGHYTVEGYRVLYQNQNVETSHAKGHRVSLYRIDHVIADDQDMAPFRTVPYVAAVPAGVMEKTVTTYRAPVTTLYPQTIMPTTYLVPGGYTASPVVYPEAYVEVPDETTETTTVTRTTTTK